MPLSPPGKHKDVKGRVAAEGKVPSLSAMGSVETSNASQKPGGGVRKRIESRLRDLGEDVGGRVASGGWRAALKRTELCWFGERRSNLLRRVS
ncbi:hypothetical protein EYF80_066156 [Liparis tanakae]|uniref:Uncharacterized protein n=1 Tax=Liparis tanakae TaxID=230148 RepID=A0A4Z2E5U8_9TELE|nr:hypothetical protein EYF80_066156 [Liparis tanakae]